MDKQAIKYRQRKNRVKKAPSYPEIQPTQAGIHGLHGGGFK